MSDHSVKDAARHEIRCMLEDMARDVGGIHIEGRFMILIGRYSSAEVIDGLESLADELRALDVIA